jgi:tight adherence protein C
MFGTEALPLLAALFVGLTLGSVAFATYATTVERLTLKRRLQALRYADMTSGEIARQRKNARGEWLLALVNRFGGLAGRNDAHRGKLQTTLVRAGLRSPNASSLYWGTRFALALGLGAFATVSGPFLGFSTGGTFLFAIWLGAIGWIGPSIYIRKRVASRRENIRHALADVMDLLVVCVDAGLGLNQALLRISEEISMLSKPLSDELTMVNLEIRAGVPREQALRNLGERVDLPDVRALSTMLIQTDRFGTSIAQALRVHAEAVRNKRRNTAEESAAKTSVKLTFPLVLFLLPAMFVVLLGGAMIQLLETLQNL